ncbi:MAG: hypothetical protein RL238_3634 [Actinomycetota bacterium]|jgi:hypothetical protein
MSDLPPPQFPPPEPPVSGTGSTSINEVVQRTAVVEGNEPWFKKKIAKVPAWGWLIAVVVLVGAGIGIAGGGKDDEGTTEVVTSSTAESVDETDAVTEETDATETSATEPEETAPEATDPPAPSADEVDGAPPGERGTVDSPVAPGAFADIGGGWRLQVLEVVADGAALVAAENEFNEPPPAGKTFSLVKVSLGYYGLEEPKFGFEPTIQAIGAGKVELDEDCGVVPDELERFGDYFAGGVLTGNLCFVTTPADAPELMLYANGDFFGGDDVFLTATSATAPAAMPVLAGPQPRASATDSRTSPIAMNTPTDVGSGWQLAVTGAARDITDAVLAENQFNEPPPAGFRFVGIDVAYTYHGEGSDIALTATTSAVSISNVSLAKECGVIPGEVDVFSDVFKGGTVAGTICFVVPDGGIDGLVLYTTSFDADTQYFGTR